MTRHVASSRLTRFAGVAAAIAVVSLAFSLPAVRAGAQAFLDLFRVVNVRGLALDASRLREIETELTELDLPRMLGERVEMLDEGPDEPVIVDTLEQAEALSGIRVQEPAYLPVGFARTGITVMGGRRARVTIDTALLDGVLDTLAISDLAIPPGIDGQTATISLPAVVELRYRDGQREVMLAQARSPEVTFPAGIDLAALAEIGLRIIGLEREEAYRFAQSIDWRSTLIVPVPARDASFREIDVAGREGLLIEPVVRGDIDGEDSPGALLLWADDTRVYALTGRISTLALHEMAQTLH